MDSNVKLTFTSDTDCKLKTSFMGSGPRTYSVSGNRVSVAVDQKSYVFVVNGN